ncbi:MAG: alpha/beta hydrolase [bacterium]
MNRYPYTEALHGPKMGIGHLKLTSPLVRLFFWLNHISALRFRPILGATKRRILVKGYQNADLACYVIEPDQLDVTAPTIVYLHGGGFFGGLATVMFQKACFYANELKCKVFLPVYRTSYKHKYPIPVEDCYQAAKYISQNGETLGVNRSRLIVYGDSAGGCLAAAVTLMARDRQEFKIALQMLIYPVTDYLQVSASLKKYPEANWSAAANRQMWPLYLGKKPLENRGYASPLYAESLTGLPPAYVEPQEIDCLCDEGIAYAKRLEAEGVPTTLNVIPGSYHAFEEEYPAQFVLDRLQYRCDLIRASDSTDSPNQ